MHGSAFQKIDPTKTVAWQVCEAQLARQLIDDVSVIIEAGGLADFELLIRPHVVEARSNHQIAQREGWHLCISPLVNTLAELGFDERTAIGVAGWRTYRKPMLEVAREVRELGDRIRSHNARAAKLKAGAR